MRQYLNPFFAHLRQYIDQFSPAKSLNSFLAEPHYAWGQDDSTLVKFAFFEKFGQEPGISPGIIYVMGTENGLMASVDTNAFRKGVERLLKKSRGSLTRPVSSTQTNLLVMQVAHPILFAEKLMPDVLYGSNGLFCSGKFTNISGLILIPSKAWCFSKNVEGEYFPHVSQLQNVQSQPKPFEEIAIHEAIMMKHVKWRDKSFQTSNEPERWVPEAIADLIEGNTCRSLPILLSRENSER